MTEPVQHSRHVAQSFRLPLLFSAVLMYNKTRTLCTAESSSYVVIKKGRKKIIIKIKQRHRPNPGRDDGETGAFRDPSLHLFISIAYS